MCHRHLELIIKKSALFYSSIFALIGVVYIAAFLHRWDYGIEGYTVWAVAFTILLVMITMKAHIHNELLEWFGKHIFSIYMLQRLPMIILDHFGCIESHKYISLVVVFLVVIPLALIFESITGAIIGILSAPQEQYDN